jgi:hypothetical protein
MKRFLLLLLLSSTVLAQKRPFELSTVDKLKATESAHFDPSLPPQNFGRWFRRLVRPGEAMYEVRDCEGAVKAPPSAASKPQCVYVMSALPAGRTVNLRFVFDSEHNSFEYLDGSIGPSDPRNKQPTRQVKKLGDLPKMINPE